MDTDGALVLRESSTTKFELGMKPCVDMTATGSPDGERLSWTMDRILDAADGLQCLSVRGRRIRYPFIERLHAMRIDDDTYRRMLADSRLGIRMSALASDASESHRLMDGAMHREDVVHLTHGVLINLSYRS